MKTVIKNIIVLFVRLYQMCISPMLVSRCRYLPTCSEYAIESVRRHGPVVGLWHCLKRVLRCNPLGGYGVDEVKEQTIRSGKG